MCYLLNSLVSHDFSTRYFPQHFCEILVSPQETVLSQVRFPPALKTVVLVQFAVLQTHLKC